MKDRVVVLTGGVGGAKLVLGLTHITPDKRLTAIVNTGDDFCHLGLRISPDIDTLLYTLSDKANTAQGWGRADESWNFMAALRSLGGEDWFSLGDGDLAMHVLRTERMRAGESLTAITDDFVRHWGIGPKVLPMSDQTVATELETDEGVLDFQRYFVARRGQPVVRSIRFRGAEHARPAAGVLDAILDPQNRAILIAPSNPFLSIDPILSVPGIRDALKTAPAPVIAVSPVIKGKAVKGPTAKLMHEFGLEPNAAAIVRHYGEVLDGILFDIQDPPVTLDLPSSRTDTLMKSLEDRIHVAGAAIEFADEIR